MSCLDVMYHHSYHGAHYLPATSAAAAAAYKAAYYHHHHQQQQQQQRKLCVYSKMQECVEQQGQQHCPERRQPHGGRLPREQGLRLGPEAAGTGPDGGGGGGGGGGSTSTSSKDSQPAEAEYLSSRCVLFTYFHGDIGDVVDEHFSRALSQAGAFPGEGKHARGTQGLWKEGASLSEGQSSPSLWNSSAYPSQASPCLPSVSVSVHPDFPPSPGPFHPADGALWSGHALPQAGLPPPASLPDAWTYGLSPQGTAGYPHLHEVYPHPHTHPHPSHPHMHMHARHPHPHAMLHPHPSQSPVLNQRFSPLLLPGGRGQSQPPPTTTPGSHGSPHGEGIKTEMDPSSTSPIPGTGTAAWPPAALHGALESYDAALDQDKVKASGWF